MTRAGRGRVLSREAARRLGFACATSAILAATAPSSAGAQAVRALPLRGLHEVAVVTRDGGGSATACGVSAEDLDAWARKGIGKAGLKPVDQTSSRQPVARVTLRAIGCKEKIPQGTFVLRIEILEPAKVTRTDVELDAVIWEQEVLDLIGTAAMKERVQARLDELVGKLAGDVKSVR